MGGGALLKSDSRMISASCLLGWQGNFPSCHVSTKELSLTLRPSLCSPRQSSTSVWSHADPGLTVMRKCAGNVPLPHRMSSYTVNIHETSSIHGGERASKLEERHLWPHHTLAAEQRFKRERNHGVCSQESRNTGSCFLN